MFTALFYLQWQSFRNRMVTRFKRLRQPKYLFGAVVGGLYVYFYFFRYLYSTVNGGSNHSHPSVIPSEYQPLFESFAALILLIIVTFVWFFPSQRAALTFTEAEVAFLFPAPISRRTLIHYKIIRLQLRIFFSAFILTLFTRRFGGGGGVLIHACGWWLILSLLNLHILGASFTRTLLLDKGISNWFRRVIVAGVVIGGGLALWLWIKHNVPQASSSDLADKDAFLDYLQRVSGSAPVVTLLYPFRMVARPFFAANATEFFTALAPVALLFVLHYLWVLYSNVAFEEASLEASQRHAARLTAIRSGNWQQARAVGKTRKKRRAWFRLAPTGPPLVALCWKNLLGTGGILTIRLVAVIAFIVFFAITMLSHSAGSQDTADIVSLIVAAILAYSALLGPQFLRADLRTSLAQADIIKTFPMRGWQIVLGEILASTILLAGFQWCLLLIGIGTVICLPGHHESLILLLAGTLSFVLPMLDFLLLLVPNASVLLFPSWVTPGKAGSQGIEAAGQRIILALVQFFAFLLALIPAGLVFCAVYFLLRIVSGPFVPIPFGALAATIIFALEAALGVFLLGKVFEKLDLSEEQIN